MTTITNNNNGKRVFYDKKKRSAHYECAPNNWVHLENRQISTSHLMYLRLDAKISFKIIVNVATFKESNLYDCWYSKNFTSHSLAKAAFDKIVNQLEIASNKRGTVSC